MAEQPREFVIPAGHARMWRMRTGECATIGQTEGGQVVDFVAFSAVDPTEYLSTSHTRTRLRTLRLKQGDSLWTNRRRPILAVLEDTVGVHDLLVAACDSYRYRLDFGVEDHRSCRSNLVEALAELGLPEWRIPDPVNLFMNVPLQPDWSWVTGDSPAKPGDYVVLEARMDLIAAASVCPQDLAPTNGRRLSDIRVRIG